MGQVVSVSALPPITHLKGHTVIVGLKWILYYCAQLKTQARLQGLNCKNEVQTGCVPVSMA